MRWINRRLTLASLREDSRLVDPFLHSFQRLRQQSDFDAGRFESELGSCPYLLTTLPVLQGMCWIQWGTWSSRLGEGASNGIYPCLPPDIQQLRFLLKAFVEQILVPHPAVQFAMGLPEMEAAMESVWREAGFVPTTLRVHPSSVAGQTVWVLDKMNLPFAAWGILPCPFGLFAVYEEQGQIQQSLFLKNPLHLDRPWLLALLGSQGYVTGGTKRDYRLNRSRNWKRFVPSGHPILEEALDQAEAYFNGDRQQFSLPLSLRRGTEFQVAIWELLRDIPYGDTIPYTELAARYVSNRWGESFAQSSDGHRKIRTLTRAVGAACSSNPLSLFLPCHRVIGKDGHLVGYREGVTIKKELLEWELLGIHPQTQSVGGSASAVC